MIKNQKRRTSVVPSGTPGRVGERRGRGVPVAGARVRTDSARSVKKSAPGNSTGEDTPRTNGAPPATIPGRSGTVHRGPDAIDWRYLNRGEWLIVALALNYHLSTIVNADLRKPIEQVRDRLQEQEPTV